MREMHVALLAFRRQPIPGAEPKELRGARRLLRHAGEIGRDGVRDVSTGPIPQCAAQHASGPVDEQQTFVRTLEAGEDTGLIEYW